MIQARHRQNFVLFSDSICLKYQLAYTFFEFECVLLYTLTRVR